MKIVEMLKNKIEKSPLSKEKFVKTKLIIAFIISILISLGLVLIPNTRVWARFPIFLIISMFTLIHFIFKIKDIYEFIYKKRYLLALIVYVFIIIMGYSGSSIGVYNYAIQPDYTNEDFSPTLGKAREIRSDEWNVNTPILVSQTIDEDSKFEYFNDNLRAVSTEMFSIASTPVNDILIIAKPFYIGFVLFGPERGLSFVWYGKIIALMLVSFELCMILSNKRKLVSLLGMILIVFSPATQWWNLPDYILWGGLALVLIDKFMLSNKYSIKLLCAFGIFISGISYAMILYPTWQIPYIYVFIPVFLWIVWKNRKEYKINWKDILIILFVILAIGGILLRYFTISRDVINIVSNTDYPGERFELGGGGEAGLFSYVYAIIFPYSSSITNPCELSGMISLYPIPMIIALIYLIRSKDRKKHMAFLIPILLVGIMLSIWCLTTTNEFFAKITFLKSAQGSRVAVPLGFLQILIMIYIMGNIKKDEKIINNRIIAIILSIITSIAIIELIRNSYVGAVVQNYKKYVFGIILAVEIYLLLTINRKNSKILFITLLIPIALAMGATVNPIQRGIGTLTDKPIAKKVKEIVHEDSENNLWLSESWPNYYLASGARVLNSTNTYPNFEMYKVVLKDKYEELRTTYNRYAHLHLQIIDGENSLDIIAPDALSIKINANTIKDLGVKYIISENKLEKFNNDNVTFENIYEEYGTMIYKVKY